MNEKPRDGLDEISCVFFTETWHILSTNPSKSWPVRHLIGCEGSGYITCYIFRHATTHISLFILHKCQVIDTWRNWLFLYSQQNQRALLLQSFQCTNAERKYNQTCVKRNKTHKYHDSQKMYSEHKRTKHQKPKFSARTKFSLPFPEAINFLSSYRFRSLVFYEEISHARRILRAAELSGRLIHGFGNGPGTRKDKVVKSVGRKQKKNEGRRWKYASRREGSREKFPLLMHVRGEEIGGALGSVD